MTWRFFSDIKGSRRLIRAFRAAGAFSVDFAKSLQEVGVNQSLVLRRLIRKGIIVHGGGGTYFLDERRLLSQRMTTVKWGMILLLFALFILMQFVIGIG